MKRAALAAVVLSVMLITACSTGSGVVGGSAKPTPKTIREASLSAKWQLRHITIELAPGQQMPVGLKLADGDRVDGYFYQEKGNAPIDFEVSGTSVVYRTTPAGAIVPGVSSDRFFFVASQAQGNFYYLMFKNVTPAADKAEKAIIFLELLYPSTGSVYTLLNGK